MWKYLKGVEPPKTKKLKTDDDVKERNRLYESTRQRKFRPEWINEFAWLEYRQLSSSASASQNSNGENSRMFCKICLEIEPHGNGNFISGSRTFKIESIKAHENSTGQRENVLKLKAKTAMPGTSTAEKSLKILNSRNFDRMCILFRNAHAIATQGRPYTDFEFLCDLDEVKGYDIGKTYRNDKSAKNFISYIAEQERIEIRSEIEKSKFISFISDGATDSAHLEAEIVYIRHCNKGTLHTNFAGIAQIGKANAENLTKAISGCVENMVQDWTEKVIGIGTDGASVMQGKVSGVVKRIKDLTERPFIQGVHCSAHRLELAFKGAVKDIKLWARCEALLLGIYLFYRNSPLNRSNLLESFNMEDVSPLMPTRVGGTRWVGHIQRALKNILTGYGSILQHLKQEVQCVSNTVAANKAKNFVNGLTDKATLTFLYFLWDVVGVLAEVSANFQHKHAIISDVFTEVEIAKSTISHYGESDGPKLKLIMGKETHQGHDLKGNIKGFETARANLVKSLVNSLSQRFDVDESLTQAASIVSFNIWPPTLQGNEDFGNEHVASLVRTFEQALVTASVDPTEVEAEWIRLKHLVYRCFPVLSKATWESVNSRVTDCDNILAVVDLVISLPSTSVEAERGFSVMKQIKTDWRSKLKDTNLSDLMVVYLESSGIKYFDPRPAVTLWSTQSVRPRRPNYMEDEQVLLAESNAAVDLSEIEQRAHNLLQAALGVAKSLSVHQCDNNDSDSDNDTDDNVEVYSTEA